MEGLLVEVGDVDAPVGIRVAARALGRRHRLLASRIVHADILAHRLRVFGR